MADGSGASRVVLMTLCGVVAFVAGAATFSLVTWTRTRSAEPGAAPGESPTDARENQLREAFEKNAARQADLERRIAQLNRELDEARARIAATGSSGAADKPKPAPTEKPGTAAADAHECVVQAVDNKNDIYVISTGTKDGVEKGMEYEVRRGGEAIGSIVIDSVFPNYASGFRKPGGKDFAVQAGDVCVRVAPAASGYRPPR